MITQNVYRVFAGSNYYPRGGVEDLVFTGNLVDCYQFLANHNYDWYQIVDKDFEIYEQGES